MCNKSYNIVGSVVNWSYLQINMEFLDLYYTVFVYLEMEKDIFSIVNEGKCGVFKPWFICHNILYDTGHSH